MAAGFLICGGSVAEDLIIAQSIAFLPAAIPGVALYRVDIAVLDFLHDAHMVGAAVLNAVVIYPIKKYNSA